MYKSKLQEMCHQRKWALPKYSCMKDGADHDPRFKASVSVNGTVFHTPAVCKSSKDAHNDAAKMAFLHFTSGTDENAGGSETEETYESPETHSNASGVGAGGLPGDIHSLVLIDVCHPVALRIGMQYQYKRKLQSYAQRRNLEPPFYTRKREGPPHSFCYEATVTVDGHSFKSPSQFKTLKEAEHAAAKVALFSLSPADFQENNSHVYKNLLQELTQNEGFLLPTYTTVKAGMPHRPTFFSTVEVEGETFNGKAGPSKKQAEINAAEVAYNFLMERKLSQCGCVTIHDLPENKGLKFNPGADVLTTVDPQHSLRHRDMSVSSSMVKCEDHAHESKDEVEAENLLMNAKASTADSFPSHSIPVSSKQIQLSAATMTPPDLSTLSIADSNVRKMTGDTSYLFCNRFRVYTSIPDMAFPQGTVVLPISDTNWVAVSLEFPNEKDS